MKTPKLIQQGQIEGKPFGGLSVGKYITILPLEGKDIQQDPAFTTAVSCLRSYLTGLDPTLTLRDEEIIYKPPLYWEIFNQKATIELKGILWGRAYKVMKLCRKKKQSFKKVYVSGRRKVVKRFKNVHENQEKSDGR